LFSGKAARNQLQDVEIDLVLLELTMMTVDITRFLDRLWDGGQPDSFLLPNRLRTSVQKARSQTMVIMAPP